MDPTSQLRLLERETRLCPSFFEERNNTLLELADWKFRHGP